MKKVQSVKTLTNKLDKLVRLRLFTLEVITGSGLCICCGKHGEKMQIGHLVSRRTLITRWNYYNLAVQCAGCNLLGRHQPLTVIKFYKNLQKRDTERGTDTMIELAEQNGEMLKKFRTEKQRRELLAECVDWFEKITNSARGHRGTKCRVAGREPKNLYVLKMLAGW